ncbi:uncharacterized protein LOC125769477 [Anopheles funestus]|nr:uncharacterized protein LOC125769477 [Anopheles funestus]
MHLGVNGTLAVVRDEYWPINGKRAIRSVIRNCYRCCRSKPQPILQPEGQLPIGRVTPASAFTSTGLDYCGPFLLKPYHRKAAAHLSIVEANHYTSIRTTERISLALRMNYTPSTRCSNKIHHIVLHHIWLMKEFNGTSFHHAHPTSADFGRPLLRQ